MAENAMWIKPRYKSAVVWVETLVCGTASRSLSIVAGISQDRERLAGGERQSERAVHTLIGSFPSKPRRGEDYLPLNTAGPNSIAMRSTTIASTTNASNLIMRIVNLSRSAPKGAISRGSSITQPLGASC